MRLTVLSTAWQETTELVGWFSDIALFGTVLALWIESSFLGSMMGPQRTPYTRSSARLGSQDQLESLFRRRLWKIAALPAVATS
jgi:hypothetical protein